MPLPLKSSQSVMDFRVPSLRLGPEMTIEALARRERNSL